MDSSQESARHFVRELIRATGWTATKLAKEAGMSHTTLSRFLNNDSVTHTLSLRTIDRLRAAAEKAVPRDHIDALWIVSQRRPPIRRNDAGKVIGGILVAALGVFAGYSVLAGHLI